MKHNQVKAGAALSLISLLISNLIPFVYTPIMLRMLGQAEYGLYGIAHSFMGYINLLNFGIGGAIVRYIAKYRASGDKEGEEKIFGLFIKIYSIISVAILAAGTFLSFNLEFYSRSLTASELETLRVLVLLMTLNTALFLPLSPFSAMITAHEKFVFSKTIAMMTTIAAPILNLLLLFSGYGSVGLVLSTVILNIITYIIYVVYVAKKLKLRPRFSKSGDGILREIVGFSLFVFLGQIVDMLYWSTDKLIIGWAIGSKATAVYNIGSCFNGYVTSISTAISGVLMPRIASMSVNKSSNKDFTELFIKVGRIQFVLISFIVSAFVAFGRQFIALWAGDGYEEAYAVALLTMIPVTVPLIQNTGLNILFALNKHKFRSIVYACIAVLNVALTFWWVELLGIIGASIATCLSYVIGNILIMNWYYYKKIKIDIPLFWKNILTMSPVMIIMGICAWFALNWIQVNNWIMFFAFAIIYSVVYFILAYIFMMNKYERDIIKKPIFKILSKLKLKRG